MTTPPPLPQILPEQIMTREEWERRFAARLMDKGGIPEIPAIWSAKEAADENFLFNGDDWLDPEDDADVEMSFWEKE